MNKVVISNLIKHVNNADSVEDSFREAVKNKEWLIVEKNQDYLDICDAFVFDEKEDWKEYLSIRFSIDWGELNFLLIFGGDTGSGHEDLVWLEYEDIVDDIDETINKAQALDKSGLLDVTLNKYPEIRKGMVLSLKKLTSALKSIYFEDSVSDALTSALRQYKHNDGSGLVFGYDMGVIDMLIADLTEERNLLKKQLQQGNESSSKTLMIESLNNGDVNVTIGGQHESTEITVSSEQFTKAILNKERVSNMVEKIEKVIPLWQREHPDSLNDIDPDFLSTLDDLSWHNDMMPVFRLKLDEDVCLVIHMDYEDVSRREVETEKRFGVNTAKVEEDGYDVSHVDELLFESDDVEELKAFLESYKRNYDCKTER